MPEKGKAIPPLHWVLITGAGFVGFAGLAVLFSIFSDRLSDISTPVYFFLLVTIGLIAAGFLFGAMRSHARYTGKAYNGTLELGGPVVVLGLIIMLGDQFRPSEEAFATTVNVFSADSAHTPIRDGELNIYYGSAQLSRKISDGQVVIQEMPKAFRGKEATFIPVVEGYESKSQQVLIPLGKGAVSIYLGKIPDSVTITGIVLSKTGASVAGAILIFADGLGRTTSDAFGNFKLGLPLKDGTETNLRVYEKKTIRYNNQVRLSTQTPLSLQLN